jgi:hypothetical protein
LLGLALRASARLAAVSNDQLAAADAFEAAISTLEAAQAPYELALARADYGQVLLAADADRELGRALIVTAHTSFEHLGVQLDQPIYR